MSLSVQLDPADSGRLIFSQPVTLEQAKTFLWARPPARPDALRPDPAERSLGGRQRKFLIDKSQMELLFSLQHGLANAYVRRVQPIMSNAPAELPKWVPSHIREAIFSGRTPNGVTRYPGTPPWGDIVVWINRSSGYASIQVYQEFPADLDYYVSAAGNDESNGRLLHKVYTQFNRDMAYFVEERRLDPDTARAEIRRINDELFKLVIEAAAGILTSGAGVAAVNNTIRASSRQVIATAERTGFGRARTVGGTRIRPLNGKVNVGGCGGPREPADVTNLNPINPNSGGQSSGIPNHVKAGFEEIGEIFEPASATDVVSYRLRYIDITDWKRAAEGTAKVMRPGGKLFLNIWTQTAAEAETAASAFRRAGFKDVKVVGSGTGTIIEGVR